VSFRRGALASVLDREGRETRRKSRELFVPFRAFRGSRRLTRVLGVCFDTLLDAAMKNTQFFAQDPLRTGLFLGLDGPRCLV